MNTKVNIYFFAFLLSFFSLNAHSSVVLNGTRLIFNGSKNEATITVTNPDKTSYLIQSWVSLNDKKVPDFIVTPPLFRIDGDMSNVLRVILSKDNLPQNKESLFWLNVKAIPPSDDSNKNSLLVAINTQIKLIYRPASLVNKEANTAYKKLTFKIDKTNKTLIASNPTAYYINLESITYNNIQIKTPGIVAPYSTAKWTIKQAVSDSTVSWSSINDFGGVTAAESQKIN